MEFLQVQDCFGEALKKWSLNALPDYLKFLRDNCRESIEKAINSLNNLEDIKTIDIDIDIDIIIEPHYLEKGLTAENLYLFIRGHNLEEVMNKIVKLILIKYYSLKK